MKRRKSDYLFLTKFDVLLSQEHKAKTSGQIKTMHRRTFGAGILATLGAAGCSSGPNIRRYNGPPVTSIVINKGSRRMYLLNENKVLKEYKVGLGFAPVGHKQIEGDGRTPEGTYRIDRRIIDFFRYIVTPNFRSLWSILIFRLNLVTNL